MELKMISALSKLKSYIFADPIEESKIKDYEGVLIRECPPSMTSQITGKVTFVSTDYSVVDDSINVKHSLLPLGIKLKVGDKTILRVFKNFEYENWQVSAVDNVFEDYWDIHEEDGAQLRSRAVACSALSETAFISHHVGTITSCSNMSFKVDDGRFTFDDDKIQSKYNFVTGDVVSIELQEDVDDFRSEPVIKKVNHLRVWETEGKITRLSDKYGTVEENITFSTKAAIGNYGPRLGDFVRIQCVEYSHKKYQWRVVTMLLKCVQNRFLSSEIKSRGVFLEELLKNKEGIVVQEVGTLPELKVGSSCELILVVKNTSTSQQNMSVKIISDCGVPQTTLSEPIDAVKLLSQGAVRIRLNIAAKNIGKCTELCICEFVGFKIGRQIAFCVRGEEIVNPKHASAQSIKAMFNARRMRKTADEIIEKLDQAPWKMVGPTPFKPPAFAPNKLPHYLVPKVLWSRVLYQEDLLQHYSCLEEHLSLHNYADKLSLLLHLEEIEMTMRIKQYDMEKVTFRKTGEFLSLEVPGLAEKRPSLLIGDIVIATNPWSSQGPENEGFIHKVAKTEVFIKFHHSLYDSYAGEDYNISFKFSRTQLRRCHQSVEIAERHLSFAFLFPKKMVPKKPVIDIVDNEARPFVYSPRFVFLKKSSCSAQTRPSKSSKTSKKTVAQRLFEKKMSAALSSASDQALVEYNDHSPSRYDESSTKSDLSLLQSPNCEEEEEIPDCKALQSEIFTLNGELIVTEIKFVSPIVPVRANVGGSLKKEGKINWYNRDLNKEQRSAVIRICRGEGRPLPYVIYGPPGTGKTVTVVEAVLQVFTLVAHSRILIATPSNSSADLVVERLVQYGHLKPGNLVRLNAHNRILESVPETVLPFSKACEDVNSIILHRLIVTTCGTAGQIYTAGVKKGHFTHVFIDEAGQATEPECLVPLGLVMMDFGQVVLAGDPHQLGPVVQSKLASRYGLEYSFLERLSKNELYERNEPKFADKGYYDPFLLTKLIRNYRSHNSLVHLPSKLFYNNDLIPCAFDNVYKLVDCDFLPKKGIPLIFHGLRGKNMQENDDPSWFNPSEAYQAATYLRSVLNKGILPSEIGIITPYRKQVEKIRFVTDMFSLETVKVGTVEEFQGQERDVIIVSTVRSEMEQLEQDAIHSLGFVRSPKRFNVAITRAKCLLIVIGDPHLLVTDENWSAFVKHCVTIGAYTGCDLPVGYSSLDVK